MEHSLWKAYGVWSLIKSKKISYLSDIIGAISLAFDGRNECFDELIHSIRDIKDRLKLMRKYKRFTRRF